MKDTLVILAYTQSPLANKNLEFFQKNGLYDERADYYLAINGHNTDVILSDKWKSIIRRDNVGLDFGAWIDVLNTVDITLYKYFIFINDTVRGPFAKNVDHIRSNWTRSFTNLLSKSVKLVGMSINCTTYITKSPQPHVQSMLLCTDRIGLDVIRPVMSLTIKDKIQIIISKEIGCSTAILNAGYNISCVLEPYQLDYHDPLSYWTNNINHPAHGDPWYTNTYFGKSLTPYDTIFFKSNRSVNAELLDQLTHLQM